MRVTMMPTRTMARGGANHFQPRLSVFGTWGVASVAVLTALHIGTFAVSYETPTSRSAPKTGAHAPHSGCRIDAIAPALQRVRGPVALGRPARVRLVIHHRPLCTISTVADAD